MILRAFLTCQKGAAAAEMALILPLSLLLIFAGLESGHYFYAQHQLVKAVRDGARFGGRHPFDEINCRSGGYISPTLVADVRAVTLTGVLSGGSEGRSGWDADELTFDVSVTCPISPQATTGIYEAAEPAPVINISATIGYKSLFKGLGVISDSASLRAEQNAVVMGV
ncbi:pilus assembly protein [Altererythrobacter sp. SALINAS58]|uniref:TadE/TadG family type IV pilus assembly protein n=1 Tax=Alteripontixanthobacter muriae TaxID=2705546 RepID=UPI0019D53660|nr:TadE family protein [Alteripontixanthobacter muriae]NTZ41953.1 pilus assembly protein [Alteripontixanthobacter muriae]